MKPSERLTLRGCLGAAARSGSGYRSIKRLRRRELRSDAFGCSNERVRMQPRPSLFLVYAIPVPGCPASLFFFALGEGTRAGNIGFVRKSKLMRARLWKFWVKQGMGETE